MFNTNRSKIAFIILFLGHCAKLDSTLFKNFITLITANKELMDRIYDAIIKYISGNMSAGETEQLCDLLFEHAPIIFSNVIFEGKRLSDKQGRQRTKMLLLDARFPLKLESDVMTHITSQDLLHKSLEVDLSDKAALAIFLQKRRHSDTLLNTISVIFYDMIQILGGTGYSEIFTPDFKKSTKMFNDVVDKFRTDTGVTHIPQAFYRGEWDEDDLKKIITEDDIEKVVQRVPNFFTAEYKQDTRKEYMEACKAIQNFISQAYKELQKLELLEDSNNSHFASELIKILPFGISVQTKHSDLGPKKGLATFTAVTMPTSQVAKYVNYFSKLENCMVVASENMIVIHETGNQSRLDEFIEAKKSIIKELLSFVKNKPIDITLPKTELEANDSNRAVVGHP